MPGRWLITMPNIPNFRPLEWKGYERFLKESKKVVSHLVKSLTVSPVDGTSAASKRFHNLDLQRDMYLLLVSYRLL